MYLFFLGVCKHSLNMYMQKQQHLNISLIWRITLLSMKMFRVLRNALRHLLTVRFMVELKIKTCTI